MPSSSIPLTYKGIGCWRKCLIIAWRCESHTIHRPFCDEIYTTKYRSLSWNIQGLSVVVAVFLGDIYIYIHTYIHTYTCYKRDLVLIVTWHISQDTLAVARRSSLLCTRNSVKWLGGTSMCNVRSVSDIRTICLSWDVWKLGWSWKTVLLTMRVRPMKCTRYCLTRWSFEIHWVSQYLVNVALFGIKDL